MDGNTTLIIIVVVFAVVILAWALLFRKKGKASIKVGDVEMSVEGENPEHRMAVAQDSVGHDAHAPAHNAQAPESAQPAESRIRLDARPGVSIEDAKAGGGILAEDSTGGGVTMKGVEAGDDIIASSSKPGDSPKVKRP